MAKEAEIVTQINTSLQAGQFSSKKFQKGRFSGIAELITDVDGDQRQLVPSICNNNGVVTKLVINDVYPFELYHRHTGSTFQDNEQDFGDRMLRVEVANMLMVVIGDRKRLKMTKEEVITGIRLGLPLELGSAFLVSNSLDSAFITPGDLNLNREDAWQGEYNTSEVGLKPETIFFTMAYAIETRTKFDCVDTCV